MNNLCFLSNLKSEEWAAWIQAIGSILAIFGAVWVATKQADLQHQNSLKLHATEQRDAQLGLAKTLAMLAVNASKAMKYITEQLNNSESIVKIADGIVYCDIGELLRINTYLSNIPIHELPHSLVTPTMALSSIVRQFNENIEMALKHCRQMNADMLNYFFRSLGEMNTSITKTCQDIESEIKNLEKQHTEDL